MREITNRAMMPDKPAWLDKIGRPQKTIKILCSGMGKPCLKGFSDKPQHRKR